MAFCVEQYKNAKHLSGEETVSYFDRYGVLDYLAENYEVFHTQSYQWILEEIDEYITNPQKQTA